MTVSQMLTNPSLKHALSLQITMPIITLLPLKWVKTSLKMTANVLTAVVLLLLQRIFNPRVCYNVACCSSDLLQCNTLYTQKLEGWIYFGITRHLKTCWCIGFCCSHGVIFYFSVIILCNQPVGIIPISFPIFSAFFLLAHCYY